MTLSDDKPRCGATIEREWTGHRVVLSRRYCRAWPLRGFDHCRYHLTFAEREAIHDSSQRREEGA